MPSIVTGRAANPSIRAAVQPIFRAVRCREYDIRHNLKSAPEPLGRFRVDSEWQGYTKLVDVSDARSWFIAQFKEGPSVDDSMTVIEVSPHLDSIINPPSPAS